MLPHVKPTIQPILVKTYHRHKNELFNVFYFLMKYWPVIFKIHVLEQKQKQALEISSF